MNNGLGPIGTLRSVDRPVRCLFCGVIGTWWTCGCEWGEAIRGGKVLRPRTVVRGGIAVIELCDELRAAARAAGVITREYRRDENARNHGVETRNAKAEVRETAKVSVSPSGSVSSVSGSVSHPFQDPFQHVRYVERKLKG